MFWLKVGCVWDPHYPPFTHSQFLAKTNSPSRKKITNNYIKSNYYSGILYQLNQYFSELYNFHYNSLTYMVICNFFLEGEFVFAKNWLCVKGGLEIHILRIIPYPLVTGALHWNKRTERDMTFVVVCNFSFPSFQ